MKRAWLIGAVVVVLLALLGGGWLASHYNRLVTTSEQVNNAWAQVENVLQRRADLIPNLVETVKGFASQEREIFEHVAEARSRLAGATTPQEAAAANAGLTSALGRLLAIVENYPQLKSNENFIRLQDELAGTENRVAVERRRYNEAVREYNTMIRRFPTLLVARLLGFAEREYFEAPQEAQQVPRVEF